MAILGDGERGLVLALRRLLVLLLVLVAGFVPLLLGVLRLTLAFRFSCAQILHPLFRYK